MFRYLDKYIAMEMVILYVVESLLLSLILYHFLAEPLSMLPVSARGDISTSAQAVCCGFIVSMTLVAVGLYRAEMFRPGRKLMSTALLVGVLVVPVFLLLSGLLGLGLTLDPLSPHSLPRLLGACLAGLVVTRIGFRAAQRADLLARRVLVIGSSQSAARIQAIINANDSFCRVVGFAPCLSSIDAQRLTRDKVWTVVIAREQDDPERIGPAWLGKLWGVPAMDEAAFCEDRLRRIDIANLPDNWAEVIASASLHGWVDARQRAMDVMASSLLLLLTLPLMIAVAIAIKIDSRGPVFYRQERVGRGGRVFLLRKFRSMAVDAEAMGMPVWAARRDPRVTRVGQFIRRTRIDELPQVLNVLSGEMSFIGPRPERPHFVDRLSAVIPGYADRACLKPGITGWAQVNFPYGASVEDARMKLAYDLYYVKHRSLLLDLMILVLTVRVILFQEGSR